MTLNGNRKLYISDGNSLSVQIPYEALLTFSVEETRDMRGTTNSYY